MMVRLSLPGPRIRYAFGRLPLVGLLSFFLFLTFGHQYDDLSLCIPPQNGLERKAQLDATTRCDWRRQCHHTTSSGWDWHQHSSSSPHDKQVSEGVWGFKSRAELFGMSDRQSKRAREKQTVRGGNKERMGDKDLRGLERLRNKGGVFFSLQSLLCKYEPSDKARSLPALFKSKR